MPAEPIDSFPLMPTIRAAAARSRERLTGTFHGAGIFAIAGAIIGYYAGGTVLLAIAAAAAGVVLLTGAGVLFELIPARALRESDAWSLDVRSNGTRDGFQLVANAPFGSGGRIACIAKTPSGAHVRLEVGGLAQFAWVALLDDAELGDYEVRWYHVNAPRCIEIARAKVAYP